jgi:hypothetical protein
VVLPLVLPQPVLLVLRAWLRERRQALQRGLRASALLARLRVQD